LKDMPSWVDSMDELQGKELEITSVGTYPHAGGWNWNEEWLEPVHKTTLREMPNTVVHCKTQEEYDELMQIYADAGWEWGTGTDGTEGSYFKIHEFSYRPSGYRVEVKDRFGGNVNPISCERILSLQEFKRLQGLDTSEFYGRSWVDGLEESYESMLIKQDFKYIVSPTFSLDFGISKSKKKGIMSYLRDIPKQVKRLLDKGEQAMYQLGWINKDLERSDEGDEQLMDLLFEQNRKTLGEKAIKEVARLKKEEKK